MDQLVLRVVPDGDGVWQIHLEMHNKTFSGRGWCWGSPESLEEFASKLSHYPLSGGATFSLGYGQSEGDDLQLLLNIRPKGSLGVLEALIEIADRDDPTCRLKAKLYTSYASIDRFAAQVGALALGTRNEATLLGG